MELSRRDFLIVSGLGMAAALAPARSSWIDSPSRAAARDTAPWHQKIRRWGQLNINERDPLDLDVNWWLDYWQSLKVDGLVLNAGGIVAYYPTEIKYHRRSQFLGDRDLFGEFCAAAKKRGLRVVARLDPNYAYEECFKAHPDWFERARDGQPIRHNESPWLYRTCMFGPYYTEQMVAIIREVNSRYDVDGFFTNGWPSTSAPTVCYCDHCRKFFREKLQSDPPAEASIADPIYRRYVVLHMERVLQVWQLWDRTAKEKKPDSLYIGNLGGGIRAVKNLKQLASVAEWFNADHQGRQGDTPIWDCAQQGRAAQAVMKGRTITNVTGAYSNTRPLWRHTTKPQAEATLWLAQTVASGMVPWLHWLGGSPEDKRWMENGRKFYQWLARNEDHFKNRRSLANLAVVLPQRTIAFYRPELRGQDRAQVTDHLQGIYYALLEGRMLFDFVHEDDLEVETLKKYRALILPNAALLSYQQCKQLRDYVRSGGSLLATFETSLYDEWGERRSELGLADVFGCQVTGQTQGPLINSYARVEQSQHPILKGIGPTALLPGAEFRVPVESVVPAPPVLTYVPPYPAYPPEMVYPRTPKTDEPAVILRENGSSRVAYFPGDVDRSFWRSGNTDLSLLLQNAIRWVMQDKFPIDVSGDGVVELFAWETEPGLAVHLINYTNPHMTRGLVRRFYPIGRQTVKVELPEGFGVSRVQALRLGKELEPRREGKTIIFDIPSIEDYEVAAIVRR